MPQRCQNLTSPAGQDREGGTAAAGAPWIISHAVGAPRAIVRSIENIGLSLGVAMSRREFIDVLGGASIAWSLAFSDASGQELRKAYRAGFLALSQLK
jgi:hypothetical protein